MKKDNLTAREELIAALKFTLFSVSAGVVEIVSFTLLNELVKLDYWASYFTALVLSVVYNFTVNRKFTFKSSKNIPLSMTLVALFYLVFTPLSTYLGDLAEKSVNEYIVLAVTMIANFVLEYLYCRFVVYSGSINTARSDKRKE